METHLPPLKNSIMDVIGNTPMVELHRCVRQRNFRGRLLVKLEYLNPGLSKKDRIALEMVREAKNNNLLKDGQPVVELTSGNTGTGLAIVCKAMGHPFTAVMSRGNTPERARMMRALGAEVVLVDQAPGGIPGQVSGADLERVHQRTLELVAERKAFRTDQFEMKANILAHERHTGPEIWEQSKGQIDAFVDFVGSGGTFHGVMKFLRKQKPDVRGYLLEPAGAAVLSGKSAGNPNHKIQGGGYSKAILTLHDPTLVTDYLQVTDEEAISGARILAAEEGIFAGFSAGAHLATALKLLESREVGSTIAFLACDSGLKYLSTELYP